ILSVVTSARPKIANYHFTTLTPNLGVVKRYDDTFVLADIPGLIEGAAEGAGLGRSFLRHIERTRMLVHVIDISGSEDRDPIEDYYTIRSELYDYSPALHALPQFIAANKMDIPGSEDNLARLKEELAEEEIPIFPISAATNEGLEPLLDALVLKLRTLPKTRAFEEEELTQEPQYETGFEIEEENGVYTVTGGTVDYILDTTDADDEISMRRFQQMLVKEGIVNALREKGAKEGDTVRLGEWEFDFVE
ncbi:MAG: Obg family GTPase CgtA, partial [Clostridia bacterium]|nr:Obg family GTPase CgtA [Clostridia bacterium]